MQQECLLTHPEIAAYNERGFHVARGVLSPEMIEEAIYGVERFYEGEQDFALADLLRPFEGWRPSDGEVSRRLNDYVSLQINELFNLVSNQTIAAIAAMLAGTEEIRLWHDQLIYKAADTVDTAVGWHTDRAYWQTCTSDRMITAFIPLQDLTENMGALCFIEGSQTWDDTENMRGFHDFGLKQLEGRRVSPLLKAGDVSFHHCRTIHGSEPNRSTLPRLSLSVHMQDKENSYRHWEGPDGQFFQHYNNELCRMRCNQPDYSDPDICPVLWSAGR